MVDGQTLEDFVINFKALLLEANIDIESPTLDHQMYIVQFYNGLPPRFGKHGYYDVNTQAPFTHLDKYWTFLRRENMKDTVRRTNEEQMKHKRAYLNAMKPASSKHANNTDHGNTKKRKTVNTIQNPNSRRPVQEQWDSHGLNPAKTWHKSMQPLPPTAVFTRGYKLPASMPYKDKASHRVTEVCKLMFPHTDPAALIAVVQGCAATFQRRGLGRQCIFHRTEDHSTFGCPTFLSHYGQNPNGDGTFITKEVSFADLKPKRTH
jgi:hypothetical protein